MQKLKRNLTRILVVEDDADNREVMVELLSIVGYDVRPAADGVEALEHLRSGWTPDLVILDLMMPRMNGWELLAELKRNDQWCSIPTLVVSAVAPKLLPSAGADAALLKPVSADALLKLVERLTRPPQSGVTAAAG